MAKGELPVPYIVAIIIALVVIAILGYMFFTHTGLFEGSSADTACQTKLVQYCLAWRSSDPTFEANEYTDWDTYAPGCEEMRNSDFKSICMELLGYNPVEEI